jgi:hypothetical protein
MKELFVGKNFKDETLDTISQVNAILNEYRAQGYDLTVRQTYYQLVAKNLIPNNPKSWNRIKSLVSNGRLAGLIDWEMIVDRGRPVIFPSHWDSPADIVRAAAKSFRIDKWEEQPAYVEVMVEKQALEGILIPICNELDVRFTANKGYSSQSALYRAGKRMRDAIMGGKDVYVMYLGDHDPSGLDMDRDILDRLSLFAGETIYSVERLALTYEQIEEFDPPRNPAKMTDSRAKAYVMEFGDSSWELDAMEPKMLANKLRQSVYEVRDDELWGEAVEREDEMRAELQEFADNYEGGS